MTHRPRSLRSPTGQSETVTGVVGQVLVRSAAQQCGRERDIVARGDVERDDLERGALFLPVKKGGHVVRRAYAGGSRMVTMAVSSSSTSSTSTAGSSLATRSASSGESSDSS